jgi:diguanylate cyclase (GGDEF)-like protein/PAS domain S-box-containing protein
MANRSAPPLFRTTRIPQGSGASEEPVDIGLLMGLVQSDVVQNMVDLARMTTGTPIAGINLVINRNTTRLTSYGLPANSSLEGDTFCAHVFDQPDYLLIVEDATCDERFARLPSVTKKDGIRFYAGAAVVTPQGTPIATVYVMDTIARQHVPSTITKILRTLSATLAGRLLLFQQIEELSIERAKFKAFMDSGPAASFMKDSQGRYVFVNKQFLKTFNLPQSAVIGKTDHELWPAEIADDIAAHDRWVLLHNEATEVTEAGPVDEQGQPTWWQSYKFVVPGPEPLLGGVALNVSDLRNIQERFKKMASTDALTGVPNRLELEQRLDESMQHARQRHHQLCVMFMDLDKFKSINDTYGHDAGDKLLVEFSLRLKRAVRHTDTVFRLAGDEFVIVLEGLKSSEEAERIAQKILDSMKELVDLGDHTIQASTSIGMAMMPETEISPQALLSHADDALYTVKRSQRGNYHIA